MARPAPPLNPRLLWSYFEIWWWGGGEGGRVISDFISGGRGLKTLFLLQVALTLCKIF